MMTIEEKARAYDEALEKAKDFYKGYKQRDNQLYADDLETIFPELKDTEDEKMRAMAIKAVHAPEAQSCIKSWGVNPDDVIAWLEKQSETMEINPSEFDLRLNKLLKQFENLPKDDIIDTLNFYLNVVRNDGTYKTDMPKFHEGDWIVFNGVTLYVKEVVKGFYRTISKDGITNRYDWDIDNVARLWTINDAKDGDVLVTTFDEDNLIVMYHSMNTIVHTIKIHCSLDNKFVCRNLGTFDVEDVKPATKEQHDLLFQNMKEAGYEWDADKKELKKIEQDEDKRLLQYITKQRNKVDFYYNGKEVSWNDIPYDVRKRDYSYHFIGDLDCFPFFVDELMKKRFQY